MSQLHGIVLALASCAAFAQGGPCEEGQIIGERPEQNARLVLCSTAARRLPELEAQVQRLSELIGSGGHRAQDVKRFVDELNAASRRLRGRDEELASSVAKLLADRQGESDASLARGLAQVALKLEELDEKIDARISDPATATRARVALAGDLGSSMARLDLETAARLIDGIGEVKKQLGDIERKVDSTNQELGQISKLMQCSNANPADLASAVALDDAPKTLGILACSPALLRDLKVRILFGRKFRAEDFGSHRAYLQQLRDRGIDLLTTYAPNRPMDLSAYANTPLFSAVETANTEGLAWLLAGSSADTVAAYGGVVQDRLNHLRVCPPQSCESVPAQATIRVISQMVRGGAPVAQSDYSAFRLAYRAFLDESDPSVQDERSMQAAAFWKSLSAVVAPVDVRERRRLRDAVYVEFSARKLQAVDAQIHGYQESLAGRGLGFTVDGDRLIPKKALEADEANAVRDSLARAQLHRKHIEALGQVDLPDAEAAAGSAR